MITEQSIREAYVRIRTIDHTIPDEVLDFMLKASINHLKTNSEHTSFLLSQTMERSLATAKLMVALKDLVSCCCGEQEGEDELKSGLGMPIYNSILRAKSIINSVESLKCSSNG